MLKRILVIAAVLLVPGAVRAQESAQNPLVTSTRGLYESVRGFITAAAEQMPEEHYGFQPTPDVRTFGELIGHIANAHYSFCASALGERSPMTENLEQTKTTKAQLIEALQASFTYCDRAYALSDTQATELTSVFGSRQPKLYALNFNIAHDYEHYGNIVTYMRMKGLVPPSSQRSGG